MLKAPRLLKQRGTGKVFRQTDLPNGPLILQALLLLFVLVRRLGAHTDRRKSRSGTVRYTIDHGCSATAVGAPRQLERGNCSHLRDQVLLESGFAGECFAYKIMAYPRHACMRTDFTCISKIGFDLRNLSRILSVAKFSIFIRTRSGQQNRHWTVVWKTTLLSPQWYRPFMPDYQGENQPTLLNWRICIAVCHRRIFPGCLEWMMGVRLMGSLCVSSDNSIMRVCALCYKPGFMNRNFGSIWR